MRKHGHPNRRRPLCHQSWVARSASSGPGKRDGNSASRSPGKRSAPGTVSGTSCRAGRSSGCVAGGPRMRPAALSGRRGLRRGDATQVALCSPPPRPPASARAPSWLPWRRRLFLCCRATGIGSQRRPVAARSGGPGPGPHPWPAAPFGGPGACRRPGCRPGPGTARCGRDARRVCGVRARDAACGLIRATGGGAPARRPMEKGGLGRPFPCMPQG